MNTPNLSSISNFKDFFLQHDSIRNLSTLYVTGIDHLSVEQFPFLAWFDNIVTPNLSMTSDIPVMFTDVDINANAGVIKDGSAIKDMIIYQSNVEYRQKQGSFSEWLDCVLGNTTVKVLVMELDGGNPVDEVVEWCDRNSVWLNVNKLLTTPTGVPARVEVLNSQLYFDGQYVYTEDPKYRGAKIEIPTSPAKFVQQVLEHKIKAYDRYVSMINADCFMSHFARKYHDYFRYIVDEIEIGSNPSFFPNIIVYPSSRICKAIIDIDKGLLTPYGVLIPGEQVKPLFRLVNKPRIKLQYIPIKAAQVPQ